MAKDVRRGTWGGARPGAGRKVKAKPREVLSISLDPDIVRQVEQRSARYNFNRSRTIENALIAWLRKSDQHASVGDDGS